MDRPQAFTRPGDLQRRLEPLRDRMDAATFRACWETVTFGRLTVDQQMAVIAAEGGLEPTEAADTDAAGDEAEYTDGGP